MAANRSKSEFVHIGPVIKGLLKECGATGGSELVRIRRIWNQVAGEGVRDNAQPAAINKATLLVHVTSSPWLHQLQFLKKDILSRLNSELPALVLEDLLFKIGPL